MKEIARRLSRQKEEQWRKKVKKQVIADGVTRLEAISEMCCLLHYSVDRARQVVDGWLLEKETQDGHN